MRGGNKIDRIENNKTLNDDNVMIFLYIVLDLDEAASVEEGCDYNIIRAIRKAGGEVRRDLHFFTIQHILLDFEMELRSSCACAHHCSHYTLSQR